MIRGFLSVFILALATSGSVMSQRLAHGTPVTLAWTVALMASVMLVWSTTTKRGPWSTLVAAQFAGAVAGVLVVHASLSSGDSALVESAPQWVNDAVFVSALLAAAWGLRRDSGVALISAGLLAFYGLTATWWHVDHFPGTAVQDFVLGRSVAVGLGLLVFDVIWSQRE